MSKSLIQEKKTIITLNRKHTKEKCDTYMLFQDNGFVRCLDNFFESTSVYFNNGDDKSRITSFLMPYVAHINIKDLDFFTFDSTIDYYPIQCDVYIIDKNKLKIFQLNYDYIKKEYYLIDYSKGLKFYDISFLENKKINFDFNFAYKLDNKIYNSFKEI